MPSRFSIIDGVLTLKRPFPKRLSIPQAFELVEDKWETLASQHATTGIRNVRGVDGATCALCHKFPSAECDGCPIKMHSGLWQCKATPYETYRAFPSKDTAQAMLDYIRKVKQWHLKQQTR